MMRDSERPELEDVAEEEDLLAGLEHSRSAQESGVSQVCAALLPCLPRTGAAAAGCRRPCEAGSFHRKQQMCFDFRYPNRKSWRELSSSWRYPRWRQSLCSWPSGSRCLTGRKSPNRPEEWTWQRNTDSPHVVCVLGLAVERHSYALTGGELLPTVKWSPDTDTTLFQLKMKLYML